MPPKPRNREILREIFPPYNKVVIPVSDDLPYKPNNIIWRNVILYGGQGAGKSELVRKLVEEACKIYGEKNVNALEIKAGRLDLCYGALNEKPIHIVFVDDVTLVPQEKEALAKFFRIRHEFRELGNRTNGYILTIMGLHRFHGLPVEMRTNFDFIVCKSCPDNKYDRDFLKQYAGERAIQTLARIDQNKLLNRELYQYSMVINKTGDVKWLKTGMAERNYLTEVREESIGTLKKGDEEYDVVGWKKVVKKKTPLQMFEILLKELPYAFISAIFYGTLISGFIYVLLPFLGAYSLLPIPVVFVFKLRRFMAEQKWTSYEIAVLGDRREREDKKTISLDDLDEETIEEEEEGETMLNIEIPMVFESEE